jgi:hypothetical protein
MLPHYSEVVEKLSQKFAASMGIGLSYGHGRKPVMAEEQLHFDRDVVQDGVLGGMGGTIYCR